MIDAGYRWAFSLLEEPNIVSRASPISASEVLGAVEYWAPPDNGLNPELASTVLPAVREFLKAHREHELHYGDFFEITGAEPQATLEWLDRSRHATPTLRYFVEVLGLRRWTDILAWTRDNRKPWWWGIDDIKDAVRVRLEGQHDAG